MTKFILIGGYPRKAEDGGQALAEEIANDFDDPVRLLICYFARPRFEWEVDEVEDRFFFGKHLPRRKILYRIATVDGFIEQLRWADAIYIRGGDADVLLERLAQCPGWEKELTGKTVAGSSAGAMALAKYWYSPERLTTGEGTGLVPVKVNVHYRSGFNAPNVDWDKADAELKGYKEDIEMLNLREGEFVVRT